MRVYELYSMRKAAAGRAGQPDVYQYDAIPSHVLGQLEMIFDDALGPYYEVQGYELDMPKNNNEVWETMAGVLAREYGNPSLRTTQNPQKTCLRIMKDGSNLDRQLDVVELALTMIDKMTRKLDQYGRGRLGIALKAEDAIKEANYRLREGGVGFQYTDGIMVRVDSQYVHAEVVKKTLTLIHEAGFKGPEDEFLAAHAHYRSGEYKDAVVDAGAAFESTLKAICDKLAWEYDAKRRASDLLKVVRAKGLYPDYLDNSFDQLLAVLKSGLPEVRNNEGSHGQGTSPKKVPDHVAAFALHLCAAGIVFLVECMKERLKG